MDLEALYDMPAWEWPEGTKEKLLALLQNRAAAAEERDMAAELLSDVSVMDDGVAEALLNIVEDSSEDPSLRGTAAVALGSALEYAECGRI